jgi:hypothetical protein
MNGGLFFFFYKRSAKADVGIVKNNGLPGSDGSLRGSKADVKCSFVLCNYAGLIFLPISNLGGTVEWKSRGSTRDPMRG